MKGILLRSDQLIALSIDTALKTHSLTVDLYSRAETMITGNWKENGQERNVQQNA
jgi:hypothetical protein